MPVACRDGGEYFTSGNRGLAVGVAAPANGAAAGLHLTVTLDPPGADAADDRAIAAAALAAGVKVQPLSWHRIAPGPAGLVLGYAATPAGQIEEGVAALAAVIGRA